MKKLVLAVAMLAAGCQTVGSVYDSVAERVASAVVVYCSLPEVLRDFNRLQINERLVKHDAEISISCSK